MTTPLDTISYAATALLGQPRRSTMLLLAIAIGVAAVVVLSALGEGARRSVVEQFSALGEHLVIVLPGRNETLEGPPPLLADTPRDLTLADAAALRHLRGVRRVAPLAVGSAPLSYQRREREVTILGSSAELLPVRHLRLSYGRFLPHAPWDQARAVVVLGATVKQELFGDAKALGAWVRLGERRFRVIGVLQPLGQSLGMDLSDSAIIPVASAQALFNAPSLFRILIQADSREAIPGVKERATRRLTERHAGEEDVTLITQDALLTTFDRILHVLTLALAAIASISLFVAGVLLMNLLLVSVAQRTAEIGLLLALGATPRQIVWLFLTEAALLAVAGGLLGAVAALLAIGALALWWPVLPWAVPWWAIGAALTMALVVGLVFGTWPARRAARLDPVAALATTG